MKKIVILLLVILPLTSNAQKNPRVDSLLAVLDKTPARAKSSILVKICEAYLNDDPTRCRIYAHSILTLSPGDRNTSDIADAYRFLGFNSADLGAMDSVLYFFNKSIEICLHINDSVRLAKAHSAIAGYYRKLSDYPNLLKHIITAYEINQSIGDAYGTASTLLNIGSTYSDMKQFDKALESWMKAEDINKKLGDASINAVLFNNLGNVYTELKEERKAMSYFYKAIAARRGFGMQAVASPMFNLGSLYYNLGNYDSAIYYMNESLAISKVYMKDLASHTYAALARVYFRKGEYVHARDLATKGAALADSIGFMHGLKANYQFLSDVLRAQHDYVSLATIHEKLMAVNDSLFNEQRSRQIAELQTKYETARKESEIIALEKERREQMLVNRMMIIVFAVSVIAVILFLLWLRARIRQRQELHNLQLALKQRKIENAALREEELKKEIEFKNRELASYTINFVQKSELMEELKRSLQEIQPENSEAAKKISAINRLVENSYQVDREWEDFKMQFEHVHHNFFLTLKERWPDLTNSDLKLCALLKLNMNMKEAARVLGISPESVKTARYRLRKKLDLSQDDNLVDFILNLETVRP